MRKLLVPVIALLFAHSVMSTVVSAEEKDKKSFLQQIVEEEENARRQQSFQGTPQTASETLKRARETAKPDINQGCPPGFTQRKIEHVSEFITREEAIQKKIADLIERYTSGRTDKRSAIDDFNKLVRENNDNAEWSKGKVTYGVCGRPSQSELLGTVVKITELLFNDFRKLVN